jgi:hypothetical protein
MAVRQKAMTRPPFALLSAAFPRKATVNTEALYLSIGHPEYVNDGRMFNTCGVRLSVALVAAGVPIRPGNITIHTGKYAGQRLESGQARAIEGLAATMG